jgi:hypothetical protein
VAHRFGPSIALSVLEDGSDANRPVMPTIIMHPDDLPLYPYYGAGSADVAWAREQSDEFFRME